MIDVRRLQVLRAFAEHHTVAATAEALGVTPSAVSQQLAALAKETEVPLVERSNRRFVLTGAGRVLLERAQVIFAELERAQADLARYAEGSLGSVRVGAFATGISNLVAPAVARLRHTHPVGTSLSSRPNPNTAPNCCAPARSTSLSPCPRRICPRPEAPGSSSTR